MSTTFPFYRAKQFVLLTTIIHSFVNNSLLLLLQLSIHTITIIHPHLIGFSPLHCHFHFIPPFRLPHLNAIQRFLAFFFFCNQSPATINTYFSTLQFFLFWYSTSQRNLPHYTSTITDTLHPKKLVIQLIILSYIDIQL